MDESNGKLYSIIYNYPSTINKEIPFDYLLRGFYVGTALDTNGSQEDINRFNSCFYFVNGILVPKGTQIRTNDCVDKVGQEEYESWTNFLINLKNED